jgi:LPS sulfotransferase NodH
MADRDMRFREQSHDTQNPALFIVLGHQRTGSTLLADRLNSHPRICCHDEVFLPWAYSGPSLTKWLRTAGRSQWLKVIPSVRLSFLNSLSDSRQTSGYVDAVGFKVMYNQLSLWPKLTYLMPMTTRVLRDPALHSWLKNNHVLVVHILRKNRLKILVSHELAAQSGRFHSRDAGAGDRRVFIPLRGLKARLWRIELAERAARHSIKGLPTIEIIYESYTSTSGPEDETRLCAALGQAAPTGGLSSPLSKVSTDNLCDIVSNYDQVASHLRGTRFECFLAESPGIRSG